MPARSQAGVPRHFGTGVASGASASSTSPALPRRRPATSPTWRPAGPDRAGRWSNRLADALVVPLRERNRLPEQAGLPPAYPEGELAADDLAAFRNVLDRLLSTREPCPAFVVDRHWNLVAANASTQRVFPHQVGTDTVRLLIDSLSPLVENWVDVAPALVERISADLMRYPDDQQLRELHEYAIAALPPGARSRPPQRSRVMCPRFRLDGTVVRTITVAARFESTVDVTLGELRVELVYPEDADSDRFFHEQAAHPRGTGPSSRV